jgi:hypothetical protein
MLRSPRSRRKQQQTTHYQTLLPMAASKAATVYYKRSIRRGGGADQCLCHIFVAIAQSRVDAGEKREKISTTVSTQIFLPVANKVHRPSLFGCLAPAIAVQLGLRRLGADPRSCPLYFC